MSQFGKICWVSWLFMWKVLERKGGMILVFHDWLCQGRSKLLKSGGAQFLEIDFKWECGELIVGSSKSMGCTIIFAAPISAMFSCVKNIVCKPKTSFWLLFFSYKKVVKVLLRFGILMKVLSASDHSISIWNILNLYLIF